MKKLFAWFLILCMCISLASCASSDPEKTATTPVVGTTLSGEASESLPAETAPAPTGPILYAVTDSQGNTIWLFGSIHVGREEFFPLPDYVMDAYNEADALAVEADIIAFESNTVEATKLIMGTMYKDGTKVADHIPAELYDRAVEILREGGMYMPTMDMFHVYTWESTIQELAMKQLSCDISLGIDRHLIQNAKDTGKTLLEVESVEFQFEILTGFSDEINALSLASAIDMYDDPEATDAQITELMDLWQSGDEAAFAAYLKTEDDTMSPEEQTLYAQYMQVLQTDRNLTMTDWAEAALAEGGDVFICVGAAHVIGDGSITDLLTQRGYTVERITG